MSEDQASPSNGGNEDGATPPAAQFEAITSQEDFEKRLGERLARERAKYSDYRDLKAKAAKLDELEEASKTELQRITERAETAEKALAQAQFDALRSEVAATKGVPAAHLVGTTREELEAHADELIEWRDQNSGPRTPRVDPNQGRGNALPLNGDGLEMALRNKLGIA